MLALSLIPPAVALFVLVELPAAHAQQAGKVARVGMLFPGSSQTAGARAQLVRDELGKLGYVEGQTITFDIRFANGQLDRVRELAAELVRARVDLIVTSGSPTVQVIRPIAGSIPIVVATMGDPIGTGFARSLARPGGNITGLAWEDADLVTKRLQLLKEAMPGVSRIALLYDSGDRMGHPQEAATAARALGLTAAVFAVDRAGDFENAFASAKRARAQAMLLLGSPSFAFHRQALMDRATKARLPVVCEGRDFVVLGCLLAYGPSFDDMFRRSATYVDRILKGAKAGDLPIELPTKFELIINLRAGRAFGLTIPQTILLQATEVVE
jgi:putative ABC transport system substrate-binding protein